LQKTYSIFLKKKNYEQTSRSFSNIEKYDIYFKRYVQTCVKKTVRLYTCMKEFRLAKVESFEHINKKIEHVSCFGL
jgi:hypothetical protein